MDKDLLDGLPQPFGFYRHVLRGDHLHFGLWPDDAPSLSLEDAQERMFDLLLSFFPQPPAKVLDVGCGLGLSASLLSRKGYAVTAIAPSREMIEYARHTYGESGVEFKVLGFLGEDEEIFPRGAYDVILFQESAQYMRPLSKMIAKARALLKDYGLLIIGDEVCYDGSITHETAVHLSTDFTIALSEIGFRIMENRKLGKNVSLTCNYIIDGFTKNFDETVSASGDPEAKEKLLFYLEGWKKQKGWYENGQMGYEIFVGKKDGFFIRAYSAEDEHTILPMFNEVFRVNRSMDHWYWKFRDNPYGSYKISETFSADGALVAHYAGYPVPFFSSLDNPDTFLSYQIGDTMTSPSVRNIGLGKTGLLARMARHFYAKFCEGTVPFIYGFNTGHIKKLGIRYLGYEYIDPVTCWVRDLTNSPLGPLPFLSRWLSGLTLEEVHAVDTEWDAFFTRVSSNYRFLVRRDAEYIKWRYLDCPDRVHRVFSIRKRGKLAGWCVFVKRDTRLIWGDALFDHTCPEAVPFLLHGLLTGSFPGIDAIEGWFSRHPAWWEGILRENGFAVVPEPNELTPCFVILRDSPIKQKLQDYLYYTYGDSDLF